MKYKPKNPIKLRIAFVGICFFLVISVVGAKAVYLQVFCGTWLSQKAANQYEKSITQMGKRGTIYDRHRNALAVSIQGTSIAAYLNRIDDRSHTIRVIAKALKTDQKQIRRRFQGRNGFVWLKRQATPKEVEAIKALELEGIGFVPEYSRFYPNKSLAAQVIGFTGIDGNGLEGIEYYYDRSLRGTEKKVVVLKDALGRGFAKDQNADQPLHASYNAGRNIVLTLDRNIQYITQTALEASVRRFTARSGMAVVMDPTSGGHLGVVALSLI